MGKLKEAVIEIEEMLMAGQYPANIAKRTGYTLEMVTQVEEQLYAATEPRNIGADYDQE